MPKTCLFAPPTHPTIAVGHEPMAICHWGLDIVSVLPMATGGFRHHITVTNYFTKWVKAELLITISEEDVERFIWRNIISHFSIPYAIISDNSTQFVAEGIKSFAKSATLRSTTLLSSTHRQRPS